MTHINCKKCNHYGLILFALKPNSNQTYFRCLKCKNEIEMYKKNWSQKSLFCQFCDFLGTKQLLDHQFQEDRKIIKKVWIVCKITYHSYYCMVQGIWQKQQRALPFSSQQEIKNLWTLVKFLLFLFTCCRQNDFVMLPQFPYTLDNDQKFLCFLIK